jgi:RHS repeat-associated protein
MLGNFAVTREITRPLIRFHVCRWSKFGTKSSAIAGGVALYLLKDGHNSTRMLVDATGAPLSGQVFRYDAFGNRLDTATALVSLLYNTEQSDPTGLIYLRSRYYRPGTGTFTSFDSYRGSLYDPLSLHKFLFCRSDAINRNDPTGRADVASIAGQMLTITLRVALYTAIAAPFVGAVSAGASAMAFGHIGAASPFPSHSALRMISPRLRDGSP